MRINGVGIGDKNPPYVIAELSANHNGSLDRALKSLEVAKACGVDAVKLQTYSADTMTIDSDKSDFMIKGGLWDGYKLYDLYKWAQTPFEWHKSIFDHAKKIGLTVFSTPFDESAVDLLEELRTPAYKIASFEVVDLPLIKYVAQKGKPMIISTGMASEAEIQDAVEAARSSGCEDLVLLHCISSYPAPTEQSNLRQIPVLSQRFGAMVGLSDHTMGTAVSVASIALGAVVIEKHFTLNRKDKGPDSEFSLEPDELEKLCTDTKNAWLSLGKSGFERQKAEAGSKVFRRSLYFVKNLEAGHIIQNSDIRRIRPGMGLPPKYFDAVIGKKLKKSVDRGTPVSWSLFTD